MIAELKISYIFQLSLDWLNSIRDAINGLTGTSGVRVTWEKGIQVIQLGDNFYNFRTIDCAKPTFAQDGTITSIEFYKVSAFCAVGKIASNEVACEECECVTP